VSKIGGKARTPSEARPKYWPNAVTQTNPMSRALIPVDDAALRAAIAHLLPSANHADVKRLYGVITKQKKHHTCSVRESAKADWKPRSTEEAIAIIELVRQRISLVKANATIPDTEPDSKIMAMGIAVHLMRTDDVDCTVHRHKVAYAHAVSGLFCRLVETVNDLARAQNTKATVSMHGALAYPVWSTKARGSGIAYHSSAQGLLDQALDRVEGVVRAM
jgi:hypothetical protein